MSTSTEALRSSEEWVNLTGVVVFDPDGWDRRNFDASWAEPITFTEFRRRVYSSTVALSSLANLNSYGQL